MTPVVGIDLGTSNSALAYVREDGSPEIVSNSDGERVTPSVVYFDRHQGIKLIGSAARDGGDPARTISQIKRKMDDPGFFFDVDGRRWRPTEISALILTKLRKDAEETTGPIHEAVLTVPASFNEMARKSTLTAAKIAGLNVKRLINEPTAAAVYYSRTRPVLGRVLVYDMGGGTLDVTVMEIRGDSIRILNSEGARHLGGALFDEKILQLMEIAYQEKTGGKLWNSEPQRQRLLNTAEGIKRLLSKVERIEETVGNEEHGMARIEITREMFEEAISLLMTRSTMLVEQALQTVSLKPGSIDQVILAGGSTRVPRVREMLTEMFGKAPMAVGNVDECVALGAALFGKFPIQIEEVCNQSYGTLALVEDARSGKGTFENSLVIPKNTPIPCSMSQTYYTSEDNETLIEVELTQGDDPDPKYVEVIGRLSLEVPPNRPAGCRVTVNFSYDENQRISARLIDEQTGTNKEVAIDYADKRMFSEREIKRKSAYLKKIRIE